MAETLTALLSVYIFVAIGFIVKKAFKEELNDRSFTIVSVYILQPFLSYWGILQRPLDWTLFAAPGLYLSVILGVMALTSIASRIFFKDDDRNCSIATITGVTANTGNLAVPMGIALFGVESVAYMTVMNLGNVLFNYTFGVYFYSRGRFSVRESLLNIIKLPILWVTVLAILTAVCGINLPESILYILELGAYASITIQLILFGLYLSSVHLKNIHWRLLNWVLAVKFILVPIAGYLLLFTLGWPRLVASAAMLQFIMPLAVNNINLASLFNCKPKTVTELVFVSSLFSLLIIPIGSGLIKILF